MKKQVVIISVLLIVCMLVLSACQPTPEESAVVNTKDQDYLFEESTNYVKYDAPERWAEDFEPRAGVLKVFVDAEVVVPDVDRYPVYKIAGWDMQDEDAQRFVRVLFDGKEVTVKTGERSKADIDEEILAIKTNMTDPNSNFNTGIMTEAERKAKIQEFESEIAKLEEERASAPDAVEREVWDGKFKTSDLQQGLSLKCFAVERAVPNEIYKWFEIVSYNNTPDARLQLVTTDPNHIPFGKIESYRDGNGTSISPEEAEKNIRKALDDLGLNDMNISFLGTIPCTPEEYSPSGVAFEEIPKCYVAYCTRTIDGIPVSCVNNNTFVSSASGEDLTYAPTMQDEFLEIIYTDNGINSFYYNDPFEIKEKVVDNIALLPFEQVIERFKKQMELTGAFSDSGAVSRKLYIDKISLGFAYVPVKGNVKESYLVPTWEFYGTCVEKYPSEIQDPNFNENNEWTDDTVMRSYMSINAIDGSVVNHRIG